MTLSPLPASAALDAYFLEARSKMLDLAAIFDRIDRGGATNDPRVAKLRQALELLGGPEPKRAEAVQTLFSLEYDVGWEKPTPK